MTDWDTRIVDGLRSAMKSAKVSMRALSERTDIPYRSLQNYLSGSTKMPASVYVQLCEALDVDNQFILEGNFHLRYHALWDALHDVLGDHGLLAATGARLPSNDDDLNRMRMVSADRLAQKLSSAYDKQRRERGTNYGKKTRTTEEQLEWVAELARGRSRGPQ